VVYLGLLRSILIYYGIPGRAGRMRRFYAEFIRPGDLCFDIGAHAGSRLRVWASLGARVVAVEPQPLFMKLLKRLYGRQAGVTLVESALGAAPGEGMMYVSRRTPTVTTLSPEWMEAVRKARSFAAVRWEQAVPVQVETLDVLIGRFGLPAFCKLDVEGYELEILKGLSQPLPCLSFEVIPAAAGLARGCVERLATLGDYEFNRSAGERSRLEWRRWAGPEEILGWLDRLQVDAPSGDIYARLCNGAKRDLP
jgi:FkbM family methyltransferase